MSKKRRNREIYIPRRSDFIEPTLEERFNHAVFKKEYICDGQPVLFGCDREISDLEAMNYVARGVDRYDHSLKRIFGVIEPQYGESIELHHDTTLSVKLQSIRRTSRYYAHSDHKLTDRFEVK